MAFPVDRVPVVVILQPASPQRDAVLDLVGNADLLAVQAYLTPTYAAITGEDALSYPLQCATADTFSCTRTSRKRPDLGQGRSLQSGLKRLELRH